jgi:recombination protein RecR
MPTYPRPLARLIEELGKFPGVGPKTAQRLALHLLGASREYAAALSEAILRVMEDIHPCPVCFSFTDLEVCSICSDSSRDESLLCVVSDISDLLAMDRAGGYRGRYHVLQGLISPMDGMGPEALRIAELLDRVRGGKVNEVILATNPTVEGDATASYLASLLKPLGVRVSRIALGLPVGGDLDYADDVTIARSLEGRREI